MPILKLTDYRMIYYNTFSEFLFYHLSNKRNAKIYFCCFTRDKNNSHIDFPKFNEKSKIWHTVGWPKLKIIQNNYQGRVISIQNCTRIAKKIMASKF